MKRHYLANKGLYTESYGFSSSQVQMWDLDRKEGWELKNRCFQIVVLENTLKSSLTARTSNQSILKEINSEYSLGAEASILWPPDMKSWLTRKDPDAGKDWWQKEKRAAGVMRWLENITDSMDMNLSKLWELVEDRGPWHATIHRIAELDMT